MKLIETEQASVILANENFVCVDENTNKYELNGIEYIYTDGILLEVEEEVTDELDSNMVAASEEASVAVVASEESL